MNDIRIVCEKFNKNADKVTDIRHLKAIVWQYYYLQHVNQVGTMRAMDVSRTPGGRVFTFSTSVTILSHRRV